VSPSGGHREASGLRAQRQRGEPIGLGGQTDLLGPHLVLIGVSWSGQIQPPNWRGRQAKVSYGNEAGAPNLQPPSLSLHRADLRQGGLAAFVSQQLESAYTSGRQRVTGSPIRRPLCRFCCWPSPSVGAICELGAQSCWARSEASAERMLEAGGAAGGTCALGDNFNQVNSSDPSIDWREAREAS